MPFHRDANTTSHCVLHICKPNSHSISKLIPVTLILSTRKKVYIDRFVSYRNIKNCWRHGCKLLTQYTQMDTTGESRRMAQGQQKARKDHCDM